MDLYPGWGLTESAASRTAEYHTPGKHGAGGVFLLTDKDGYNFGPVNSPRFLSGSPWFSGAADQVLVPLRPL